MLATSAAIPTLICRETTRRLCCASWLVTTAGYLQGLFIGFDGANHPLCLDFMSFRRGAAPKWERGSAGGLYRVHLILSNFNP